MEVAGALKEKWSESTPVQSVTEIEKLSECIIQLKRRLQFKYWLYTCRLEKIEDKLNEQNIFTLEDVLVNLDKLKSSPEFVVAYPSFIALEADQNNIYKYPVNSALCALLPFVYYVWTFIVIAGKLILVLVRIM